MGRMVRYLLMRKIAWSISCYKQIRTILMMGGLVYSFLPAFGASDSIQIIIQSPQNLPESIAWKEAHSDTLSTLREIDGLVRNLRGKSYLEASVDTTFWSGDTIIVFLHMGPTYQWISLDLTDIEDQLLKQINLEAAEFENIPFDFARLQLLFDKIIAYYEERGYPFAEVGLEEPYLDNGDITAKLSIQKNRYIRIKEVINAGDVNISNAYLERYLGLRPGSAFRKTRIADDAPRRLNELAFATQRREPLIQFKEDEAVVNVFLNKRNASRFDFVLGVLPNSRETGRLLFTGTANMELFNPFGEGERIFLKFQRLRPETQELRVEFNYPYLLDLPYGIDARFNLYTRDSTNRDISFDLGVIYMMQGGDYIRGFWNQFNSDILSINEAQILNVRQLPRVLDVRNALYGIEILRQRLDYRFNPRKGWRLQIKAATGTRRILENTQITDLSDPSDPEFDFSALYEDLVLSGFQFRANSDLSLFKPLSTYTTLLFRIQSGYIYTPGEILRNEAFRIGGNQILRGFDEEAIFSSHYQIVTLEYRLLTGKNSNIFIFGDGAYIVDETGEESREDFPYGFGAGLNFETPVGVFGLTAALGAQQGNPVDFRATRIHFGYISLF